MPRRPASSTCPQDTGERLVAQAARFGSVELSRAADIVASGLTEMRGATAPRLLLELICARVLLPGADDTSDGVMARLDRIERRLDVSGAVSAPTDRPTRPAAAAPAAPAPPPQSPLPTAAAPAAAPGPAPRGCRLPRRQPSPVRARRARADVRAAALRRRPGRRARRRDARADRRRRARRRRPPRRHRRRQSAEAPAQPRETAAGSSLSLVDVRRLWPDIVDATKARRRVTWIHLTQNAQVDRRGCDDADPRVHQRRARRSPSWPAGPTRSFARPRSTSSARSGASTRSSTRARSPTPAARREAVAPRSPQPRAESPTGAPAARRRASPSTRPPAWATDERTAAARTPAGATPLPPRRPRGLDRTQRGARGARALPRAGPDVGNHRRSPSVGR